MNVRSIATAARLADFEAAVENVKFDVIGVSETRMAGKGRIDLSRARNHRGQMLADFCEERKLFLANSFFKKRLDDRWTWRNDALGLKKEIDYVLLRSMKGVVDVGVLTSVNTGSDHRMLRCKMRLNPISQPVRRPRGFPVIDSDLLCSTAQCLLHENMMTGDTIKDYDTITRVITTATQMSTRPISLLSTLYKVLTRIFTDRLTATIEEKSILPPEQAGFRKHFSTIDHIHTINMITEKCHEFNIELCAVFVDFKKAFDSVELPMIWKALEHFGVEENLIMAIQLLYAHSTAAAE
ncbi:hypothetical protein COOONC_06702 [Cooperia oncophora]